MAGYGGQMRQKPRELAGSQYAEWADPTGIFFGLPTPEVEYEEAPYEAFGAPQTREALANMRAKGPSAAALKTSAATDKQARALFLRGQTAASPVGTQQAMAGGADAQRTAIMAGARQRAMEEQGNTRAIHQVLGNERDRESAAMRASNRRTYALERAKRKMFMDASEQDWDRMSKQLALAAQFSGNETLQAGVVSGLGESYTDSLAKEHPGLWGNI